jgi:excisionase family DNA binding protein
MIERYFTVTEIAVRFSLSQRTIKREITANRLEAIRVNDRGDYRVSERALNQWVANRQPAA